METQAPEATLTPQEPVKETTEKQEQNGKTRDRKDNKGKRGDDHKKGEKKNDKPRRNRYEEWEKEMTVTLDTPLPELPKEKLAEPNNDDLRAKLKDLDTQINGKRDLIVKLKAERSENIEEERKARDEKQGNLKGLFSQAKEIGLEITDLNTEKKLFEADIDRFSRQKELIIKGMFGKKLVSLDKCESMIDDLSYRQKTERLTATQERAILKDLNELENSLPLIKEVEEKEKEIREVKDKKKIVGKKIHDLIEKRNKVSAKIDEIKEKQKEKGEEVQEKKDKKEDKPLHPITIKINGCKSDIDKLRKDKQTLKDEHDKHYKSWRDQNELEQKIKWIKKKKQYLQRKKDEEDRIAAEKAEDDRIKAEKEEYEKLYGKPKKYQPEIDVCDNLISFLGTLKPKELSLEEEQNKTFNEKCVEEKLAQGDWKKEKVHILKKVEEDQGVQPGAKKHRKKGKGKNKTSVTEEDKGTTKLTLTIETLSYFDQIKVSAPNNNKEIDGVVEKIQEKKEYFIKISEELNDGKQPDEEEAKNETKETTEGESKPVKEKKGKKEKVTLEDEDMFPAMG